jgi:hypothetical protein
MTKAEEMYHRFVNYEWNEIGEGMKVSIIKAIDEALKEGRKLPIHGVVKSLPIQDLPNCTRVEVIDQKGRSYVNWKPSNKVRLSMQDDGRTAKIFID